jgi:hypothetical protein
LIDFHIPDGKKFPWCTVKPKSLYRYKIDTAIYINGEGGGVMVCRGWRGKARSAVRSVWRCAVCGIHTRPVIPRASRHRDIQTNTHTVHILQTKQMSSTDPHLKTLSYRQRVLRPSITQVAGLHAAPLLTRINFDGRSPQAGWQFFDSKH